MFSASFSQKKKKNYINVFQEYPQRCLAKCPQGSYSKFHKFVENILLLSGIQI